MKSHSSKPTLSPEIMQLITNYRPNKDGVTMLAETKVVLLVGITGAGKNTILSEMLKTNQFHDMVTSVTREPRMNNGVMEKDGIDYYFLSEDQAVAKLKNGEYVEVSPVHNRIYGVTVDEIRTANTAKKIAIADITVLGVEKYKALSHNVIAIFVLPPSFEEWQTRMRNRFDTEEDFMADWPIRRKSAIMELQKALQAPYYHFVINDQLDHAVDACMKIVSNDDRFHRKDDEKRLMARDLLEDILANS
ncbi:hypothetical protein KBD87_00875 [Candidatus Saccharibacteria bacterium]|jgi:guanylate kinase|nr:hypothetical protein [Candidatus Saccharibacteria bacterium]